MACKLNKTPIPPTSAVEKREFIIRQGMARVGLRTQKQLGYYLGLSQQAVCDMFSGKTTLTVPRCKRLREVLRLTDEEYFQLVTL